MYVVYVYISCRVPSKTSLDVCETVTFCRSYKYRCELPPSIFATAGFVENILWNPPYENVHVHEWVFMNLDCKMQIARVYL